MKKTADQPAENKERQDRPRAGKCLTTANQPEPMLECPGSNLEQPSQTVNDADLNNVEWELTTDLFQPPDWMVEQVAARLPGWAPVELVRELLLYQMANTEPGSCFRSEVFEYPDAEQAILERILTRTGMDRVWQSIATACDNQGVPYGRFTQLLWRQLANSYAAVQQATKTPKETQDEWLEIANLLRQAVRKIERNRSARIDNKHAIHELTARQLTKFIPSADHPLHDQVRMEAQINNDVLSTLSEETAIGDAAARETRLAEALSSALSLSLVDVAGYLADRLEFSATYFRGEVKELNNPSPVFIRRVRSLFKSTFNKPMTSTLATLLNVALDLPHGDITEDRIRKTREQK